jgi:hypothetical protein
MVSSLYIASSLRYTIKQSYEKDAKVYYMQPDTLADASGSANDADKTLVEIPPDTK